uniref:Uncharacterized protein MANES_03G020200 n=1 Tax=Rhizophora mucronata TaxID=61149 RepID=A0A2P2QRX0_RHIMU
MPSLKVIFFFFYPFMFREWRKNGVGQTDRLKANNHLSLCAS